MMGAKKMPGMGMMGLVKKKPKKRGAVKKRGGGMKPKM
jgi:hypothetical protein